MFMDEEFLQQVQSDIAIVMKIANRYARLCSCPFITIQVK